MIIEGFFNIVYLILDGILNLLDVLPDFPASLIASVDSFFDLVFSNLSLLGFFVRIETIQIIVPLFIVVYNAEYVYRFIMWILRKVPMVGIK